MPIVDDVRYKSFDAFVFCKKPEGFKVTQHEGSLCTWTEIREPGWFGKTIARISGTHVRLYGKSTYRPLIEQLVQQYEEYLEEKANITVVYDDKPC